MHISVERKFYLLRLNSSLRVLPIFDTPLDPLDLLLTGKCYHILPVFVPPSCFAPLLVAISSSSVITSPSDALLTGLHSRPFPKVRLLVWKPSHDILPLPAFCVELLKPCKQTLEMSPKIILLTPPPVAPYTPPISASHSPWSYYSSAFWVFYHSLPVCWVGAGSFLCLVGLYSWTLQTYTGRAGSETNSLTPTVSEAMVNSVVTEVLPVDLSLLSA